MTIYKVKFATVYQERERTFSYCPTKKAAKKWIAEECPHDVTLGWEVEIEPIELPTTRKEMCYFLNEHHTFW